MKTYRITKYNPDNRDIDGVYLKDEWTSISDIGENFGSYKLTSADYLIVENQYLKAYEFILRNLDLNSFVLKGLEKYHYEINDIAVKDLYNDDLEKLFNKLNENYCFGTKDEILNIIRLILREHIWGKIESTSSSLKIEFGHDFYSYLISEEIPKELINEIRDTSLYIEEI